MKHDNHTIEISGHHWRIADGHSADWMLEHYDAIEAKVQRRYAFEPLRAVLWKIRNGELLSPRAGCAIAREIVRHMYDQGLLSENAKMRATILIVNAESNRIVDRIMRRMKG